MAGVGEVVHMLYVYYLSEGGVWNERCVGFAGEVLVSELCGRGNLFVRDKGGYLW
jgi:hypothetical protein